MEIEGETPAESQEAEKVVELLKHSDHAQVIYLNNMSES